MSDDARPDGAQTDENTTDSVESAETRPDGAQTQSDTFPREYVEGLRKESAGYRDRAKTAEDRADSLAKRLHRELVAATGKLENPDDLPFDAEHLDPDTGADKLHAALDALLAERPYFAKRVVKGDAGQGPRGASGDTAPRDFAGFFRGGNA